jgi:hypothetical protein
MVEAVRFGVHASAREHSRWRHDAARAAGRTPADGTTIEQLARDFPDHVGLPN